MTSAADFFGVHCDIARGAYLREDVFLEALELAAAGGITHFLPYLENAICLPSMAKAAPSCAYTPAQWRLFDAKARAVGIELVPHFNVIGHTDKIEPVYPELCGSHGALDVTSPAVKEWTRSCLTEFCSFSEGRHFLIGGDEWQPPNELLKSGADIGRIWADQINFAAELLLEQNRIPIVWHDMMMHYPQTFEWLNREVVIAFWFYDEDSDYAALSSFKECGFRTLMAAGICNGTYTRRRHRAVTCSLKAMREHHADGFFLTCWEYNRWELHKTALDFLGRVRRGEPLPELVLQALSLWDAWKKLPETTPTYDRWRHELREMLQASIWQEQYPEAHACLTAHVEKNAALNRESYLRYHHPEGPLFEKLAEVEQCRQVPTPMVRTVKRVTSAGFGLQVHEDTALGTVLKIQNERESFCVYPAYGASLQDWRRDEVTLLPDTMPAFVKDKQPASGGYHSYSRGGGLRPIWALGIQHNPCILWQYPFSWEIVQNDQEKIVVELSQERYHVQVCYRICACKGESGFTYTPTARNRLPHCFGAFNFNLPLTLTPESMEECRFRWQQNGTEESRKLLAAGDSFIVIPAPAGVVIDTPDYQLAIVSPPEKTAGYYVDWSPQYVTPDLHGHYVPLKCDEVYQTSWRFSAET